MIVCALKYVYFFRSFPPEELPWRQPNKLQSEAIQRLRLLLKACDQTPRRSKMAWLRAWKFLMTLPGVQETYTPSCSYGSPFQKEVRFLACNMVISSLCRPCTQDHKHIRIHSQYTKRIYCPRLAEAIAELFAKHLRAERKLRKNQQVFPFGLESVLINEVAKRAQWSTSSVWKWKGRSQNLSLMPCSGLTWITDSMS